MSPTSILLVCTGNMCRSPMASALLDRELQQLDVPVSVSSAGTRTVPGRHAPPEAIAAMHGRGLDMRGHCSRSLRRELIEGSDLVLGMAREHLREVVILDPSAWFRCFTLKELVGRGQKVGPRLGAEGMDEWLGRMNKDRSRSDLLGWSDGDDLADPLGGTQAQFEESAREIDRLIDQFVTLAWPRHRVL